VPEASVDEDGQPCAGEYDVRAYQPAAHSDRKIYAKAHSATMKLGAQCQLSPGVASTIPAHPFAYGEARGRWIRQGGHPERQSDRRRFVEDEAQTLERAAHVGPGESIAVGFR
jgi:hypothetical protein